MLHSFTSKDFKEPTNSNKAACSRLADLKIYKDKSKEGVIDRIHDEYTLIGRSLFKKETNLDLFTGLKVTLSTGETGKIESGFGQSGKFKIRLDSGLLPSTRDQLEATGGKSKKKKETTVDEQIVNAAPIKIFLNFKRFIYDEKKRMVQ